MVDAPTLRSPIADVSPDFVPNRADAVIIRRIVRRAETPRAIKLFALEHRKLSDYGYWFTLSTLWVSYTGWSDLQQWKWLLSSLRPRRETSIMKPSELAVWRTLPDVLTVLRVHRPGEQDWISYTIDIEAAKRFAARRAAEAIQVYRVRKSDALCLFTRRGEAEVLVLDRRHAELWTTIRVVREAVTP
jgi:hypothetical protein